MGILNEPGTPKEFGYRFPAEWEPHEATWLSWPHNLETWPDKRLKKILPAYAEFAAVISQGEELRINVVHERMKDDAWRWLEEQGAKMDQVRFFMHPTNDAWCRDHGPAFLVNPAAEPAKIIINWEYNAWGGKYPPFDLDNQVPLKISDSLKIPAFSPDIVMEGGSVEFNGKGALLTTEHCLLNKNRNPHLSKLEIEQYLVDYYGVDQIIWLHEGIIGDDTDGHIDDITRFVNPEMVVTVIEHSREDDNYEALKKNAKVLNKSRLLNDKQIDVVELPMPEPLFSDGLRMPASYANFYICNQAVIVPQYGSRYDQQALQQLENLFTDRKVIGIDSSEIIWGLGSFHCLSQQEPK